ncbi:MAG: alternative ribosome rescue aminoacyl-tRNA hydrolase ArfB [Acidimicrobiia bacterium]
MTSGSTPAPRPDPDALRWRFGTSGGPGGQHANRTETRVEVTFDVDAAKCLTETQRHLLLQRLGTSVVVTCDETRSQWRNRAIAYERLCERIASALEVAPQRVATRPGRAAKKRRMDAKRRRGEQKNLRRKPEPD